MKQRMWLVEFSNPDTSFGGIRERVVARNYSEAVTKVLKKVRKEDVEDCIVTEVSLIAQSTI